MSVGSVVRVESNPLREIRHKLGITQEELAKEAGVSRLTVARIERGLGAQPFSVDAVMDAVKRIRARKSGEINPG